MNGSASSSATRACIATHPPDPRLPSARRRTAQQARRAQAASGGLWLCSLRPWGLVAVVVPSAFRVMVQPHRCTRIRWWNEHSSRQLPQAGGAALAARDDVMHVTPGGRHVAAGGGAVLVAGGDRPAQVRRHQVGAGADVQRQADRPGRRRQGPGPQPRREPAGPGQQRHRLPQDQLTGGGQAPLHPPRPRLRTAVVVSGGLTAAARQVAARQVASAGTAAAWQVAAVRSAAAGQAAAVAGCPAGLVLGPVAGEAAGELVEEVVVDPAGHDRRDRGVAVITGPGPRPRRHRPVTAGTARARPRRSSGSDRPPKPGGRYGRPGRPIPAEQLVQ